MPAFRLERVLRLRGQLRRLRMHEAAVLAADLAATEERGRALAAAREQQGLEEASVAARGTTAASLQLARAYGAALAYQAHECTIAADAARTALVAKRAELESERREERKLEQLAALHHERVAEDEARAIATLLDELALRTHGSGQGGRP